MNKKIVPDVPATTSATTKASTDIPNLDSILSGGFPRNRLYLIQGDPGVGKTTLGLQYLLEGTKNGEKGLYVTLSETTDELRSVAQSHGWSLDSLAIHELSCLEHLSPTPNTLFHPSEVELQETTHSVLERVEEINPTRVVIDSLSELRLLARDPLRYRRHVLWLKQYFSGRQCTVLLMDDRTADDSHNHLESLAHGVLSLEQLSPLYGAERRRLRCMKMRGVNFRGGYHDFNIVTGGLEVFPRLIAAEHREPFVQQMVASGIVEIDTILGGGLDRGTSTLLLGPAGTGKSVLACQYAFAAAQRGDPASIYIFDESISTLFARTVSLGINLPDLMAKGLITVQQIDPAEMPPGQFIHLVRKSVEQDKSKVIVIDSLNGYLNSMPEEHFLTVQLHELLTYLRQHGVLTMMVVSQSGVMGNTTATPVDVSYLADTVVLLRYFEAAGEIRKAISVLKKRSGRHETTIRELRIGPQSLRVSGPLKEFHGVFSGVPMYRGNANQLI